MKLLLTVLIAAAMIQAEAQAKIFSVEKTAQVDKRAADLLEIVKDVENTCENGCRYKLSSIKEVKIVESISKDDFYTWTFIDNVRNSYCFSHIQISDNGKGEISITSTTPDKEKIRDLSEKSDHTHKTPFDDITSTWVLKENFDENHNFINTSVTYSSKLVSDSTLVNMFAGIVRSSLDKTARELFETLNK